MPDPNENILDLINGASPEQAGTSPPATQGGKEHRSVPRFFVKWRAVALIDEQDRHHGFIKDISIKGAAVFLDRNLQSVEFIKLHIHIPPSHVTNTARTVQVYGKVVYAVYDSRELLFRSGIHFLRFDSEHDPGFLEMYLTNCQPRIA